MPYEQVISDFLFFSRVRLVALKKCEWGRIEEKGAGLHNIEDGVGILWLSGQHRGG